MVGYIPLTPVLHPVCMGRMLAPDIPINRERDVYPVPEHIPIPHTGQ
jgi:hypothetical protein